MISFTRRAHSSADSVVLVYSKPGITKSGFLSTCKRSINVTEFELAVAHPQTLQFRQLAKLGGQCLELVVGELKNTHGHNQIKIKIVLTKVVRRAL
jgi:hypothetical protein